MKHSLLSFVALTTVTAFAIGFSNNFQSPTGPSDSGSAGTVTNTPNTSSPAAWADGKWTLVSMETAGQPQQPAPAGVSYAVTFADNRVSTKADCNTCGGGFATNGDTVTIGPLLACTRAACSTMAFENAYVGVLAGESTARVDGDSLTLTSSRGVLRFHR